MYEYTWYQWITFFFIYCFFGWIFESTYVSLKSRHFVNRGFLRLPLLPLYGTGAVMMLWVSLPVKNNLFLVYLAGVLAATVLEFVTGWGMERLFRMKYWDYSNQRFNVKGYICLSSSIAWGFLTIFLTEIIHRPIEHYVLGLPVMVNIIFVAGVSLMFAADTAESVKAALDLAKVLDAMTNMRAELDDIQVQMALLKAETSDRVAEAREEAAARLYRMKTDAANHAYALKDETAERLNELVENTKERMSGLMESTADKVGGFMEGTAGRVGGLMEDYAGKVGGLMEDTAGRADGPLEGNTHRADGLTEGNTHRADGLTEGNTHRADGLTEGNTHRADGLTEGNTERAASNMLPEPERTENRTVPVHQDRKDRLTALSHRLASITQRRHALSAHMNFYRRSMLKGNPSASSSRFADALKELKEIADRKKKQTDQNE